MIYIEDQTTVVEESQSGTTETTEPAVVEQPQVEAQPTDQTQTVEDSFFDPQSVPEELVPAYKQMQAAFTKKTQEAAQQRKEAEALRQDAENYRKYQQHIPIVEEMLAKQQATQPGTKSPELEELRQMYKAEGYSDEAIDMMEKGLGFVLNRFNQSQSQQREVDRVTSGIEQAAKVDPRLTDSSLKYQVEGEGEITYGQMVERIVASDSTWQKDPVAATKRAIKQIDALIGKAKTDGKEELSSQAKAKARQFPQTTSSPQSTSDTAVTGSIREIGAQVMKDMGVK